MDTRAGAGAYSAKLNLSSFGAVHLRLPGRISWLKLIVDYVLKLYRCASLNEVTLILVTVHIGSARNEAATKGRSAMNFRRSELRLALGNNVTRAKVPQQVN